MDAFQGGERDVIVLSSVRTKGTGFIDEPERVNVAITRAKRHMLFVGKQPDSAQPGPWLPSSCVSCSDPSCLLPQVTFAPWQTKVNYGAASLIAAGKFRPESNW